MSVLACVCVCVCVCIHLQTSIDLTFPSGLDGYITHTFLQDSTLVSHVCASSVAKSCLTLCHPWTAACQAPSFMWFTRQECWHELPLPPPGNLPNLGKEPTSSALEVDSLPLSHLGSPSHTIKDYFSSLWDWVCALSLCWELCYPKFYGLHHPVLYFFSVWPFPSPYLPLNLIYLRARLVDSLWSFSCNGLSHRFIGSIQIFLILIHT